jgi:hypothetical protein
MVPNPAMKTAAARLRSAEAASRTAGTARDAALVQLHSPAPSQATWITNQVITALAAPVEAARARSWTGTVPWPPMRCSSACTAVSRSDAS